MRATSDVTYVSLNFDNPDLHRIMPWCGTQQGPASIVNTFVDVARYWEKVAFDTRALLGDEQYAALFGKMTYRSTVLGKTVTSPFAVYVHVTDGRCDYMQFMEDTFATGASFRQGGSWTFASNPDGEIVTIEATRTVRSHRMKALILFVCALSVHCLALAGETA